MLRESRQVADKTCATELFLYGRNIRRKMASYARELDEKWSIRGKEGREDAAIIRRELR